MPVSSQAPVSAQFLVVVAWSPSRLRHWGAFRCGGVDEVRAFEVGDGGAHAVDELTAPKSCATIELCRVLRWERQHAGCQCVVRLGKVRGFVRAARFGRQRNPDR